MVESTLLQGDYGSEVIKKESEACQVPISELGMPTVWHLESNHIGVVHPYRGEIGTSDTVSYMLTIYDWVKGDLKRTCHIKLWDTPYHEKLFMINKLNYHVESDRIQIVFSQVYKHNDIPAVTVVELRYTNAVDGCKGKTLEEAVIPQYTKTYTFVKDITTMVALHLHVDAGKPGSLFLLCAESYYVFTRKNTHSDYEMSD